MPDNRKGTGGPRPSSATPERGIAAASVDPILGRTISGRYKVKSLIARGGMGRVYRAEQVPLGRVCALKVLHPTNQGDVEEDFHRRFFLEASTAAKLSHPNTVTIYDYGASDDVYYIAMEYLEGRTLQRVLLEQGPLPEARAAHITRQICRSLREAHGLGVVHRDLKPGNVLLVQHGDEVDHVKVLDFGLVKDVSGSGDKDLTETGVLMGSPKYMAPEQIVGNEVSPATDVYSLGVVLYEMLAGRVPFDRGANFITLSAHVNDTPPPIAQVNPNARSSPAMEAIVLRCLEKEPEKRFGSMNELLLALKSLDGDAGQTSLRSSIPNPPPSLSDPVTVGLGGDTPHPEEATVRLAGVPTADPTTVDRRPSAESIRPPPPADTEMVDFRPRSRRTAVLAVGALCVVGLGAALVSSLRTPEPDPPTPGSAETRAASAPSPLPFPSPSPAASAPLVRRITIETTPPGASVLEDGKELCPATPCEVTWQGERADPAAPHQLSLERRGLRPLLVRVEAGQEKIAARLDAPASARSSGEKPSGGYKPSPY